MREWCIPCAKLRVVYGVHWRSGKKIERDLSFSLIIISRIFVCPNHSFLRIFVARDFLAGKVVLSREFLNWEKGTDGEFENSRITSTAFLKHTYVYDKGFSAGFIIVSFEPLANVSLSPSSPSAPSPAFPSLSRWNFILANGMTPRINL